MGLNFSFLDIWVIHNKFDIVYFLHFVANCTYIPQEATERMSTMHSYKEKLEEKDGLSRFHDTLENTIVYGDRAIRAQIQLCNFHVT